LEGDGHDLFQDAILAFDWRDYRKRQKTSNIKIDDLHA
jgi:hypothetical protein